jgi:enoyl-[acyl-carrier protein] reductase/trans-2-enoyl-CoA reductase (NAD+)
VRDQIEAAKRAGVRKDGPHSVLVIGASTGYGLAARITAAFGFGAATLGVFFEKPATEAKPGTAGWYNAAAFDTCAKQAGLVSKQINGDAFADETRARAIEVIRNDLGGSVDLVIYSLASPVRRLPQTGEIVRSVLKPIGQSYATKAIDTGKDTIRTVSIEPASEAEIRDTVAVMGGGDWALWIDALSKAGVLAKGAKSVAFSYVGAQLTQTIYRDGTIGEAKKHLEATAEALNERFSADKLDASVAVLKSVVTQASAAIPVLPLYISLVFKVMKEKGLHEGTIEQTNRLFHEYLYRADGAPAPSDEKHRLRPDAWELRDDVQQECATRWAQVTDDNLFDISDYAGYKREFLQLFGFERSDVDYQADVNTATPFDCMQM